MKILIIGGTNYIGRCLAKNLNDMNDLTILSRRENKDSLKQIYIDKYELNIDELEYYDACLDFTIFNKRDCSIALEIKSKINKYYMISTSWLQFRNKLNDINQRGISELYLERKYNSEKTLLGSCENISSIRLPPIIGKDPRKRLGWNLELKNKIVNDFDLFTKTDLMDINSFLIALNNILFKSESKDIYEVGISHLPNLGDWVKGMEVVEEKYNICAKSKSKPLLVIENVLIQSLCGNRKINEIVDNKYLLTNMEQMLHKDVV